MSRRWKGILGLLLGCLLIVILYVIGRIVLDRENNELPTELVIKFQDKVLTYEREITYRNLLIPVILENREVKKIDGELVNKFDEINNYILSVEGKSNYKLKIVKDDKILLNGESITDLKDIMTEDGVYDIYITIKPNRGIHQVVDVYHFNVEVSLSKSVKISKEDVVQGDYFYVQVDNVNESDVVDVKTDYLDKVECYHINRQCYAYLPVNKNEKLGEHVIQVYNHDELIDTKKIKIEELSVNEKEVALSDEYINLKMDMSKREEFKELLRSVYQKNPGKLFEDSWIIPLAGKLESSFGDVNIVNRGVASFESEGVYISSMIDTPVKAVASGKVLLARNNETHGNYIVIDHGMEVYSYYFHLNSLNVAEGDMVKQNDGIGTVGSSGVVLEDKLFLGISVQGIFINPKTLINF